MMPLPRIRLAAATVGLLLVCLPALADPQPKKERPFAPPKPEQLERLRRMSPEEREQALQNLPPGRREMVQRRLEALERLPKAQRQRLENSYAAFQEMEPDQQREVRRLLREFNQSFPSDSRMVARTMVRRMRGMNAEERRQFLDRPAVKEKFTEAQRDLLRDMAEKLPQP